MNENLELLEYLYKNSEMGASTLTKMLDELQDKENKINGKNEKGQSFRKQLEIDFVVNAGNDKYYIQSALNTSSEEKNRQERTPLLNVKESFPKIIIQKDDIIPWKDEDGILHIGIEQFLLEKDILSPIGDRLGQ